MSLPQKFIDEIFQVPYELGGRTKEGMDCWGLVVICYKELFGIDIPIYDQTVLSMSNKDIAAKQIEHHLETSAPFERVSNPQFGDFVLIKLLGNPVHIGFMLDDRTMLHTHAKTGVSTENIREVKWKPRIQGFYRHEKMIQ